MAFVWQTPKTDWNENSRFNIEDYNRIKNNLNCLNEIVSDIFGKIPFRDMGADHTDRRARWDVNVFNAFEFNLESLAKNSTRVNYGMTQTFYGNGIFIKWDELNRIESACLDIYEKMVGVEVPRKRLPFRLGGVYFPTRL